MSEIILNNISKYYGNKKVIENLSLKIDLSGVSIIMGESGCGKTTLLRLLTNLEKTDSGEITGVPDKVSFMFQEDRLLEQFSALENVKLVSDIPTAEKYIDKVFLADDKDTPVSELSGGMKRRVALARAMAFNSKLIILDEPFKGMDADLKAEMIKMVVDEGKSRPVIVVVHEEEEAQMLSGIVIKLNKISVK